MKYEIKSHLKSAIVFINSKDALLFYHRFTFLDD